MLGQALKNIRKELGYKSARAFYQDYIGKRTRLDINYAYYMKIEADQVIPSPSVISTIGSALPPQEFDLLILTYCAVIFPNKARLFKKLQSQPVPSQPPAASPPVTGQRFLTQRQIAQVARSRLHYFLFLILTLARGPVELANLQAHFKNDKIESALKDLSEAALIRIEGAVVDSISKEMRFPQAESSAQRKIYEQIDLWNLEFNDSMKFEKTLQKMHLRRVSSRYLKLILAHCELLSDLIRASDETDQSYNEEVLMLTLSLSRGSLPG